VRSVSEEQHSLAAQGPQPAGAGRRRAIGFVARSVEYRRGYTPSLAPRIGPGGAPAKIGSNFCTGPYWIRTKEGRARARLQQWLTQSLLAMEGRVLSFNTTTAHVWADQKYLLEQDGHRMPIEDSYIAATARRHGLTIVTGNDQDFRRLGLKVFNPFRDLPRGAGEEACRHFRAHDKKTAAVGLRF